MKTIGFIGRGAIATFARTALQERGFSSRATLVRAGRHDPSDPTLVASAADLPQDVDLMIDCAGHAALAAYGPDILARGMDLITLSLGALADPVLEQALQDAAAKGGARLHLASGAIGALDCLGAAQIGGLKSVVYTGRKPPKGWAGSAAEDVLDLAALTHGSAVHFEGTARAAALAYPKNANVAAAVALAGIGFDATQVRLIADAEQQSNRHEITAKGHFGEMRFEISGAALPDNPRSSALAAMSVVSKVMALNAAVTL